MSPSALALLGDGTLLVADRASARVLSVSPDRAHGVFAGGGFVVESGQLATDLVLVEPTGLAVGPDGSVFIADGGANRVYRVSRDGRAWAAAGTGVPGYSGDGASALLAELDSPHGLAVDQFGAVYIADSGNHAVRRLGADGNIETVAGTGSAGYSGDGGAAVLAALDSPAGVALGRDGLVFIADTGNDAIRAIDTAGVMETFSGGPEGTETEDAAASATKLARPRGVWVGPDGDRAVYVADSDQHVVRRTAPKWPGYEYAGEIEIASEDGTQVFVFDELGRHLLTRSAESGEVVYAFEYLEERLLSVVRDGEGNELVAIERDAEGQLAALRLPNGTSIEVAVARSGYLTDWSGSTLFDYATGGSLKACPMPGQSSLASPSYAPELFSSLDPSPPQFRGPTLEGVPALNVESGLAAWLSAPASGDLQSDGIGALPGALTVELDGTAAYQIPITLPPNRGGMTPDVAIAYRSSSGNGLLGKGFGLRAGSSIVRCPRTLSEDGEAAPVRFDETDSFCLDGRRLVETPAGSGEYRTLEDTFSRVKALQPRAEGPRSFVVETKDGRSLSFGDDGDGSASVDVGGVRESWLLVSASDRSGNLIEYEYEHHLAADSEVSVPYLTGIRYGGHETLAIHDKRVELNYSFDRRDHEHSFLRGSKRVFAGRLESVVSVVGPDPVRRVELEYNDERRCSADSDCAGVGGACARAPSDRWCTSESQKSLLASVRDCAVSNGVWTCLAPTRFAWTQAERMGLAEGPDLFPRSTLDTIVEEGGDGESFLLDLDGDGRTDVLYPLQDAAATSCFWRYLDGRTGVLSARIEVAGWGCEETFGSATRGQVLDYDGDGGSDLLLVDRAPTWRVLHPTVRGGAVALSLIDTGVPRFPRFKGFMREPNPELPLLQQVYDSTSLGIVVADINGDALPDLIQARTVTDLVCVDGTLPDCTLGLPTARLPGGQTFGVQSAEALCAFDPGLRTNCYGRWFYFLNRGPELGFEPTGVSIPELGDAPITSPMHPIDVDGDRKQELLFYPCDPVHGCQASESAESYRLLAWRNSTGGLVASVQEVGELPAPLGLRVNFGNDEEQIDARAAPAAMRLLDWNGDGRQDVVRAHEVPVLQPDSSAMAYYLVAHLNRGDGSFSSGEEVPIEATVVHLRNSLVADLDRDGRDDLLIPYEFDYVRAPGAPEPDGWPGKYAFERYFVATRSPDALRVYDPAVRYDLEPFASVPETDADVLRARAIAVSGIRSPRLADTDGDGRAEILSPGGGLWVPGPVTGGPVADLMKNVWDGMEPVPTAPTHSVTYASLGAGSGAGASTACEFPCVAPPVSSPVVVAHERRFLTVAGAHRLESYSYSPGYFDLHGRGFLGFDRIAKEISFSDASPPSARIVKLQPYVRGDIHEIPRDGSSPRIARNVYIGAFRPHETITAGGETCSGQARHWAEVSTTSWEVYAGSAARSYFVAAESVNRRTVGCRSTDPRERPVSSTEEFETDTLVLESFDRFGNRTSRTQTTRGWDLVPVRAAIEEIWYAHEADPDLLEGWLVALPSRVRITETVGLVSHTREVRSEYDGAGRPVRVERGDPGRLDEWRATSIAHDAFGNPIRVTVRDAFGVRDQHVYVYDDQGVFVHAEANALGHVTRYRRDPASGALVGSIDPNGLEWVWSVDGFGRALQERRPDGSVRNRWLTFDDKLWPGRNLLAAHEAQTNGAVRGSLFDGAGQVIRSWESGAADVFWVRTDRLAGGMVRARTIPQSGLAPVVELLDYDGRGRISSVTRPGAGAMPGFGRFAQPGAAPSADHVLEVRYDGLVVTEQDGAGHLKQTKFDAAMRPVEVSEAWGPSSIVTRSSFGPFAELETLTDPKGYVRTQRVDSYGRRRELNDPDLGRRQSSFDALDRMTRSVDASGEVTRFCYDALGRLSSRVSNDGEARWSYDRVNGIGRVASTRSEDGPMEHFVYDEISRLGARILELDGERIEIGYEYGADSELARVSYPASFSARYERARGHVTTIRDASGAELWHLEAEGPSGQVASARYAGATNSPLIEQWSFDPQTGVVLAGSLESSGGRTIQRLGYSYDVDLNVVSMDDELQSNHEKYELDELGRLTGVTRSASPDGPFVASDCLVYDEIGNILSKQTGGCSASPPAAAQYGYQYQLDPRSDHPYRLAMLGGQRITTDANGNEIARPGPAGKMSLQYSSRDKLRGVETNDAKYQYRYDAVGRRVTRDTEALSGRPLLRRVTFAELYDRDTGASVETKHRARVYGPNGNFLIVELAESSNGLARTDHYVHRGRDGSPNLVRSFLPSGGLSVQPMSYDAFGVRHDPTGFSTPLSIPAATNVGYTGHEAEEELGLVNMRGRMYDPRAGRFLTADPVLDDFTSSQAANRYAYVRNNPVTLVDPSGYEPDAPAGYDFENEVTPSEATITAIPWGSANDAVGGTEGIDASEVLDPADFLPQPGGPPNPFGERLLREFLEGLLGGIRFAAALLAITAIPVVGPAIGVAITYLGPPLLVLNLSALTLSWLLTDMSNEAAAEQVVNLAGGAVGGAITGSALTQAVKSVAVIAVELGSGGVRSSAGGAGGRATQIHGAVGEATQRRTTIAVTETAEGTRVVTSSEPVLRPAQRSMLRPGEVAGAGPGHAEVTGVQAAQGMALTPTGVGASRPICPACAEFLEGLGIKPLSPLK
ncbi:MAG: VCBS repeat-containing protein [Deltaproteobacteria bacterium]|nr:VCBS repeat-containing protein [Deltaproteobacteria bacterium]